MGAGGIMRRVIILAIVSVLFGGLTLAWGAVPGLMSYQGRMTDSDGNAITDTLSLIFTIYDDPILGDPGNILWDESHPGVSIIEGLFQAILGAGNPAEPITDGIFPGPGRWLGIRVEGGAGPRTRLR